MRRMMDQLFCLARAQLTKKVRALPRWRAPVGEGAILVICFGLGFWVGVVCTGDCVYTCGVRQAEALCF